MSTIATETVKWAPYGAGGDFGGGKNSPAVLGCDPQLAEPRSYITLFLSNGYVT